VKAIDYGDVGRSFDVILGVWDVVDGIFMTESRQGKAVEVRLEVREGKHQKRRKYICPSRLSIAFLLLLHYSRFNTQWTVYSQDKDSSMKAAAVVVGYCPRMIRIGRLRVLSDIAKIQSCKLVGRGTAMG